MAKFGVGQPVSRVEDARLVTGHGRYIDDITLPGQLHAAVLRSPHAHAAIRAVDTSAAARMPGVAAVITAEDLQHAGIGDLPCLARVRNRDGSPRADAPRPALAREYVRFVGDPVAMVVAESAAVATDALERIDVDYAVLDAVTDTAGALEPDAPQIREAVPGNLCFDWEKGDAEAVEAAFRRAERVVSLDLVNNRVVASPMETRGAIGAVDDRGRLVLHVSSQGAHLLRNLFAKHVFGIPAEELHVVTPDVGGGFGMKIFAYPEYVLVLYAARRLGRPVKWIGQRAEAFLGDVHGRDHVSHADMALDAEGRFLGLRVRTVANLGAYLSNFGPFIATDAGAAMLAGCYTTPAIHVSVRGAFTNTSPTDAYRGAGRPEAAYLLERLVDKCGRETGLGPVAIRRRNFIRAEQMPYTTALGSTYDTGDFARNMDDALALADWDGVEARRQAARGRGRRRGIGMATYIEASAGGSPEAARVQVDGAGGVTVFVGTQSNGQGHETAFTQLVCERFGVAPEQVRVVQGDTDRVASGGGTMGSRSIPVGGAAVQGAADRVIEAATERAAEMLEVAAADVAFRDGRFRVAGTDLERSFTEVARFAAPADGSAAFDENAEWGPERATYPNGTHICELEVDAATGGVELLAYTVVDDFGTTLNPRLLEGQVHGGIAQGVGQALMEHCVYDDDSGQLVTGSFMDYTMPRAADLPPIAFRLNCVPSTTNALGMKGAGEAGAIGAPPAVINALVDALGVDHVDMPATPLALWRILHPG
ncbi:xanthine dehydrogenase family protein molybdopterin-binding subunit [Aquisalimonas lutea]|uniref:xanthine dehydrogenase family protein molybdopterin-binding subunit n=1 Tax=Aquisalimonas lutea TaxID=1327750 RepID=UPI0025B52D82|nr:xanthine dehydrogenase family protein molybdopterin-binding subunit [Aquisalimonas lutea]MDN3517850.1 xanthine dehydrogenase family protein molybdopterin-binding subunit [Aquisalimonas lutea]